MRLGEPKFTTLTGSQTLGKLRNVADNCFPCLGEGGGNCWQPGSTYSLNCDECSENHPKSSKKRNYKKLEVAQYKGESGKKVLKEENNI